MNDKGDTSLNATDIQARRRLIFRYTSLGLTPLQMHPLINDRFLVSIGTIRRDIRCIDDWLPGLIQVDGDGEKSLNRIVGLIQESEIRLAQLMYNSSNESAAVGAAKALGVMAANEADLLMNAGIISRTPLAIQHIDTVDLEGLDQKAVSAILVNFEHAEADRHRRMELENSYPGGDAGQESVEKLGRLERVATANGERIEASFSDFPESSQPIEHARPVQDATIENTEMVSPGGRVEPPLSSSVDTSRGGRMAGGYIVRRRSNGTS